jgi:hypothetical protein
MTCWAFAGYSGALAGAFDDVDFVELDRTALILQRYGDEFEVMPSRFLECWSSEAGRCAAPLAVGSGGDWLR